MLNKKNKGITLIALVITIIILLILAGISISMLTGQNGILNRAQEAKVKNEKSQAQEEVTIALNYLQIENETSSATLTQENKRKILEDELKKSAKDSTVIISGNGYKVNHRKYDFYIDENLKLIEDEKEFDPTEWDKTAAPEDIFIWGSNDPNNSEYGTVVGYTDSVDNYPVLRYPSRCTKLGIDNDKYTFYEKYSEGKIFLGSRDITANIEKIELPSTVTEIGRHAFNGDSQGGYNFSSLKSLDLPNSVTKIGDRAFKYCDSLKDITIPNNVTNIGEGAFENCTGLTKITIPNNVTNIGDYTFSSCTGLTKITIPNSVTNIGERAFENCKVLTDVKIPDSVTNIGNYAFSNCKGLTKIAIPNSVTNIGNYAFSGCTGLTDVKIPDSVTTIGTGAFGRCTGLTDVKIPNSVTTIGTDAFENVAHITYAGNATGSPWGAKRNN